MRISDWSSDVCSSDLTARTETMPAEVAVASHISLDSPLGPLTLRAADGAVIALDWGRPTEAPGREQALLAEAARQPGAYFAEGHSSEERRAGKECVSTCRSRASHCRRKKKNLD